MQEVDQTKQNNELDAIFNLIQFQQLMMQISCELSFKSDRSLKLCETNLWANETESSLMNQLKRN